MPLPWIDILSTVGLLDTPRTKTNEKRFQIFFNKEDVVLEQNERGLKKENNGIVLTSREELF